MRRRQPFIAALLALALLLGQWLTVAHQPDHALQPGGHACAVCVYAQGADTGALPVSLLPLFSFAAEAPAEATLLARAATFDHQHPIRGPPALLA
ncbi:MAG TPA: hypothetical protein VM240_07215 [Verrucomicrobiae bacterium]|nr:hypothetical protein [Verrucomicrobiae bacterium]